jgi:hypothetical protein
MAAFDDRCDVYDRCIKYGLDPDRESHQSLARELMYAEGKYAPDYVPPQPIDRGAMLRAMKARYGSDPVVQEATLFAPREGADYNMPSKGAYAIAVEDKVQNMAKGMLTYIEMLPEHLQRPMIDYLTTGKWNEPDADE